MVLVISADETEFVSTPSTVDVSCEREIYVAVPRPFSVEVNILLKFNVSPDVVLTRIDGEI